jgi:hypothetical protein
MKVIISERQYKLITEDEDRKVLKLPGVEVFGGWEELQTYLDKKGNPLFSISGDLNLFKSNIKSLDNLVSVGGSLDLNYSEIESLGNIEYVGGDLNLFGTEIESLDNLKYVGGNLDLRYSYVQSIGDLEYVGGDLLMRNSPLSKIKGRYEIADEITIKGIVKI